jgi:hypothetical protein
MMVSAVNGRRNRLGSRRRMRPRSTRSAGQRSGRFSERQSARRSAQPQAVRGQELRLARESGCLAGRPSGRATPKGHRCRSSAATTPPTCSACTPKAIRFPSAEVLSRPTRRNLPRRRRLLHRRTFLRYPPELRHLLHQGPRGSAPHASTPAIEPDSLAFIAGGRGQPALSDGQLTFDQWVRGAPIVAYRAAAMTSRNGGYKIPMRWV